MNNVQVTATNILYAESDMAKKKTNGLHAKNLKILKLWIPGWLGRY
jgi:hypothetical protein